MDKFDSRSTELGLVVNVSALSGGAQGRRVEHSLLGVRGLSPGRSGGAQSSASSPDSKPSECSVETAADHFIKGGVHNKDIIMVSTLCMH